MFECRFNNLFCVWAILCICFSVGSSHTKKCKEAERQSLLKLKGGFVNGRKLLSSWKGEDCCKWKGISCDNLTGHVTSLDLEALYYDIDHPLQGKLDSSICELQHLTSLNLSQNRLEGKIPKCLGSLGQLIELNLAFNYLVGVVPPTLGNLSNLQTLWIQGNYLVANDLEWVSHLSNLRYLDLSSLNLSQVVDWLPSISKIVPSLSQLSLSDCGLTQVNPESTPLLNSSTSLKKIDLRDNYLNSFTLSLMLNVGKFLTHLDLRSNEIEGSLPKSFLSLCHLKVLQLFSNKLSGQLSDSIQQLQCSQNVLEKLELDDNPFSSGPLPDFSGFSSLTSLLLRNTNIIGPVTQSFGHLPHLLVLYLSHNRLSGVDNINKTQLPNLLNLGLSFNELSGSLPLFEVAKLTSLEFLDLSHNQLNGSLPYTIGQLSHLWYLDLSSNKLNGVINETHLLNLYGLKDLRMYQNSLSFNLSSNWVPPFHLKRLYASSCILGPKFPTWLKNLKGLAALDISNSGLSDSIPEWFLDLFPGLEYVNVSHNQLSGPMPRSLRNLNVSTPMNLSIFDFSFNNLSGPLPPFPQLEHLFLSNNKFSGPLSSFCASSPIPLGLTYLDLSSNLLEGPLLDCWGKFKNLKFLNLAKNKLSGRVPKSFGTLRQMVSMHLNNNNFSGEIPFMTLSSSLTVLDLGDNNLQGTLPAWVGRHLHQLIVLSLRENKFQGNIPESLCNLSFLQVLDLSLNNFTGEIPQCFSHITALSNTQFPRILISHVTGDLLGYMMDGWFYDEATLSWKGKNWEYGKNLGLMTIIDLSCNHLTGKIPQSITKLVALAGLNLSRNNLSGSIPNNIGHMEWLESLDLSRNHLSGTQLQSFKPSSYIGNTLLCGQPLTNHCQGDVMSPTGSPDKHVTDEDEDKFITYGFYISLVLGFIVGFWGVCGTLVIKASWRHAYFQFFNNMNDWMYVTIMVFIGRMKRRF
ncbi:receptor-like protein EIX1 isoform X2 [Lotus japonicus]|uniref:receptor-like protein EIX1 isoform X2 n=1 Tax=Lotus japonicus TaxID=34305 RepID=UPI00258FE4D5|nr:receptor-like protein EIX1 isoform X2 [Lotus japonicus]